MFKKGTVVILALSLALTMFISGCGAGEVDGDEARTELVWGIQQEADTLDPRSTTSAYAEEVFHMVYNSLVHADENLEIKFDLATDLEIKDDDVTYVFTIRDDVTFHDGEPLTAHDVVFTYESILDPNFGSIRATRVGDIVSVTALDDYTVEFVTAEPDASFLYNLDTAIVPSHAAPSEPYSDVEEEGVETGSFAHKPIGSGPFKVIEWRPNDQLVLERYEDYHEGPAHLERIVRREIPEVEAIYADLMAGNIDKGVIPDEEIDNMAADPDFALVQTETLNYFPIFINHGHDEMLAETKVRQALNKAADYDLIVERIFPTSTRAHSAVIRDTWAYDEDAVRVYEHDPEAARELLAEAGYPDGIELELILSSSATNVRLGEMLTPYFAEAGITLTVTTMDFGTMLDRTNDGEYQLSSVGNTNLYDPDIMYSRYVTGTERGAYTLDDETIALIEEARKIVDDQDARAELYSEIQRTISEMALDIPMRYSTVTLVWSSDFNHDFNYIEQYRNMNEAYWD